MIFQRTGIPPDEVMAKPRFTRTFMLQSMIVQLEAEAEQRSKEEAERQRQRQESRRRR